ncbi:MAG: hypothetical protein IKL57_06775 [Oscillospiraceae bacterium]|nr:hypothetical protein [Oscillospiraceae bacterium]MBR3611139.1 hypothetical protein [Oscillospiraceae bacterium]
MKRILKKTLPMILSVIMILGMFGETAFAEENKGETEQKSEKSVLVELIPEEEEKKKGKIKLNDTVKFDNEKDTPETFFVKKPAGGNFYAVVISDFEYDEMNIIVDGFLKAEFVDFDPEKYQSVGETYRVFNRYDGMTVEGFEELEYGNAKDEAEKLNAETKTTLYDFACNQFVYVAKITVPKNYGVSFESGNYHLEAMKDGVKYASVTNKIVSDISIFEYEYVKWVASDKKNHADVLSEEARGYSDYLSYKYGYGDEKYNPPIEELPTVISTTGFRAIVGKELNLFCGEEVKIRIREISTSQRGVNFIYKNTVGEIDEEKKTTNYALTFYGEQPIESDFVIEWNLGVNAFELRESFKIKVEEEDIITYYITKDGKYFNEFVIDYMVDDINEDIMLTLENEADSVLGTYRIVTKKPADAPKEEETGEVNPNTGAPTVSFVKIPFYMTESSLKTDMIR